MDDSFELLITEPEHRVIRGHYARAGPLLDRHFHGTPLAWLSHPRGLGNAGIFHKYAESVPSSIATIAVRTSSGEHQCVALDLEAMRWLVETLYAVEFLGWTPSAADPNRAAFGRILLHPYGGAGATQVVAAARALLDRLAALGLAAVPVVDGGGGVALFLPFDDEPTYDALAPWLRAFAESVAADGDLFTVKTLAHDKTDRVHVSVLSNHPGMGSLLPYSLRGTPALDVVLPCPAERLEERVLGVVTAADFGSFLDEHGDEFAQLRNAIPEQCFAGLGPQQMAPARASFAVDFDLDLAAYDPHARIINAAIAVLADGKVHSAADILAEAIRRELVPKTTGAKYLYVSLHGYVLRTQGAGRVPQFVQVPGTSTFRLNRPADDWPDVALPPLPRWIPEAEVKTAVERLRSTSVGHDPAAFEQAACDAFGLLGFIANHVGGNGEPDGILIAPLGVEGYRVVLECKTTTPDGTVSNPRPEEAAKFREGAGARYSILLGPAFGRTLSLEDELKVHAVALWTVDDLAYALEQQITPDELRDALAPGYAQRPLQLIVWAREHGERKRVAVIADVLARVGCEMQRRLASGVPLSETPRISEETLFVLVDDALMREGVAVGASRADAQKAIRLLEARGELRATEGGGYVVVVPNPPSGQKYPAGEASKVSA